MRPTFRGASGEEIVLLLNRTSVFRGDQSYYLEKESKDKIQVSIDVYTSYSNEYGQEWNRWVTVKAVVFKDRESALDRVTYTGESAWMRRTGNDQWVQDELVLNIELAIALKAIRDANPSVMSL